VERVEGNTVIIQLIEKYQESFCTICNKPEVEITMNGVNICPDCVCEIMERKMA